MQHISKKHSSGFTIVELLIVIVVIAILAAITIVSYSGITKSATVASIQSDLTNAATILKIDQTTNDNFPTTLALADSGKGISPSQTMDSVIYIPDNTSNPKNFCLQYKKGDITYAVDNTTQPSKGVCLQNLVTNGDFSYGTSGWGALLATQSVTSNKLITLVSAYGGNSYQAIANLITGRKYYLSAFVVADSSSVKIQMVHMSSPYDAFGVVSYDGSGTEKHLSNIFTTADSASMALKVSDYRSSTWTNVISNRYILIDLTTAFGAGNEPTKAQMDTIMTNYPNSWFNITAKVAL